MDRSALEAAYGTASMSVQIPTTEKGTHVPANVQRKRRRKRKPPDGFLKPNTGVAFLSQEKSGRRPDGDSSSEMAQNKW